MFWIFTNCLFFLPLVSSGTVIPYRRRRRRLKVRCGVNISLWSGIQQTENDSLLRRMNEDIVLAAKRLSGILCQNFFIKIFFLDVFRGSLLSMHAVFPPTSWKPASIQQLVVKCLVLSPFLPRCLQPVGRISVLFKMSSSFILFFLLFFVCLVWFFTNL